MDVKYVWVVETFMETDVPKIERWVLDAVLKNGVRVIRWGNKKHIRKALELRFFYEEKKVTQFYRRYMEGRIKQLAHRIDYINEVLAKGISCHPWSAEELPKNVKLK